MKRAGATMVALAVAFSLTHGVFANGQGAPIEPASEPVGLEPSGPAPGEIQTSSQSGQNWWLIALSAAVAIGIIIALTDDSDNTSAPAK